MTQPLSEIARLIRSKNAGPFILTFDIVFDSKRDFQRVRDAGVLNVASFASLYRCDPSIVRFFECENALAFKFSIPRPIPQGDPGDGDMHGGQQFIPLMSIQVP
ncbi:DUF4387 domain-containing protein [Pigmentiphaga soli]|uniref:DUF4387 domain-containing protein n=1 Tax=Pigmentiphaga soli TaxID=1007095 RepID=A0ABP8GRC0_9BURK